MFKKNQPIELSMYSISSSTKYDYEIHWNPVVIPSFAYSKWRELSIIIMIIMSPWPKFKPSGYINKVLPPQ